VQFIQFQAVVFNEIILHIKRREEINWNDIMTIGDHLRKAATALKMFKDKRDPAWMTKFITVLAEVRKLLPQGT
jgi:hypothetical protein